MGLRGKVATCAACSNPGALNPHEFDYPTFVGETTCALDWKSKFVALPENAKTTPSDFLSNFNAETDLLIDTRPKVQFDITHLPNSTNIPMAEFAGKAA